MILIWYLIFINQNIEKLIRDPTKIRIEQPYPKRGLEIEPNSLNRLNML